MIFQKEIKAKPKIVGLEVKELIILLVSFFLFHRIKRFSTRYFVYSLYIDCRWYIVLDGVAFQK